MRGRRKRGLLGQKIKSVKSDFEKMLKMDEGKLRKLQVGALEQTLSAYLQLIERELTQPNTKDVAELQRCAQRVQIINKFISAITSHKEPENELEQQIKKTKLALAARANDAESVISAKASATTAKPVGMKALFKNAPKQAKAPSENLQMMAKQAEEAAEDIGAQLEKALADEAASEANTARELADLLAEDAARKAAQDEALRLAFEEQGIEPDQSEEDGPDLEVSGELDDASEANDDPNAADDESWDEEDELDESSAVTADDAFVQLYKRIEEIDGKIFSSRLQADRHADLAREDSQNFNTHVKNYAAAVNNCESLIRAVIDLRQRVINLMPDIESMDRDAKNRFVSRHREDIGNLEQMLVHYQKELSTYQDVISAQSPLPAARAKQPAAKAAQPKEIDETLEILKEIGDGFIKDDEQKLEQHLMRIEQLYREIREIQRTGKPEERIDDILDKTGEAIALNNEVKRLADKVGPEFAARIGQADSQLQQLFALNAQMIREMELAKALKQPVVGKSAAEVLKQASKEKSAGLEPQPLAVKIVEPKIVVVEVPIAEIKPEELLALIEEANQILKIGITHISLETRLPDHELEEIRGRINNPIHARIKSAVERYAIDSNPAIKTLYDQYFENFRNKRNIVRIHDGMPPSPTVGRVTEPFEPAAPAQLDAAAKEVKAAPAKVVVADASKGKEEGGDERQELTVDEKLSAYIAQTNELKIWLVDIRKYMDENPNQRLDELKANIVEIIKEAKSILDNVNVLGAGISDAELNGARTLIGSILTDCADLNKQLEEANRHVLNPEMKDTVARWEHTLNQIAKVAENNRKVLDRADLTPEQVRETQNDVGIAHKWFEDSKNIPEIKRILAYADKSHDPKITALHQRHKELMAVTGALLATAERIINSFPPPPPPPTDALAKPIATPRHYFFAYTLEEFTNKGTKLQATNNNNLKDYELAAERALTASKALNISASTQQQRSQVFRNVNDQLFKLNELIGFLEDCERRANGINTDMHAKKRTQELIDTPMKMSLEVIQSRLDRLRDCQAKLVQARNNIQFIAEPGAKDRVYYTKLNYHNVCTSEAEAMRKATEYLRNNGAAGINDNHTIDAGLRNIGDNTTEIYSYRFTPTKITTSTGTLPVALIQQTNQSQTYSKQTVLTPKGTLEALKKLTHDEQVEFVRDMIETQLASITTNGPIRLSRNWDPALAKAAALHCKAMGYDLQPNEWLKKIKPKEVTDYQTKHDHEPFMQQAKARRDMKLHTKTARPIEPSRDPGAPLPKRK